MPTSKAGNSCRQHVVCDSRIENSIFHVSPTHIGRSLVLCLNLWIPLVFHLSSQKWWAITFHVSIVREGLRIRGKKKSYVLGALDAKIWLAINSYNSILKVLKKVHLSCFFLQLSLNTEKECFPLEQCNTVTVI